VADFAQALPAETFLIIFGIGREHAGRILEHKDWLHKNWSAAQSAADIQAANQPLRDFFGEQVERRRADGAAGRLDAISGLLTARYDGRPLTSEEIVSIIFMTMMASLDSTTSALSLVFLHLARHPEDQSLVRRSPDRVPALIEEILRKEPVTTTARVVTRDVERKGVRLRAGDKVLMSWGMAGIDPRAFDQPHKVDLDRGVSRHLAFGVGPHRCLGMGVARRLINIAVEEWHAGIPAYRVAPGTEPVLRYSVARGAEEFEIELS
jgi:cytochrome P450